MDERIGFGLYQSCGNRECWTCVLVAVVWVRGLDQGREGRVVLCPCEV